MCKSLTGQECVDGFSLSIFIDLPTDGEVVDVGCGTGRAVAMLDELGITKYLGIDPSKESIAYCQREYPDLSFEVANIRELGDVYPERFAGFILTAVLLHIPRTHFIRSIVSLRKSLKKGAHGLISLPRGCHGHLTGSSRFGMRITLYTELEISRVFTKNGFTIRQMCSPDDHMLLVHAQAV